MRFPYLALVMVGLVCCWHDVDRPPEKKTYELVSFTRGPTWTLVLRDPACPAQTITETNPDDGTSDAACLAKLAAGPQEEVRQRIQQGCMPGTPHRTTLGGCRMGGNTIKIEGPPCSAP